MEEGKTVTIRPDDDEERNRKSRSSRTGYCCVITFKDEKELLGRERQREREGKINDCFNLPSKRIADLQEDFARRCRAGLAGGVGFEG